MLVSYRMKSSNFKVKLPLRFTQEEFFITIFPLILIVFSPLVDMLNGYVQNTLELPSPIGLLFRGILIIITMGFPYKLVKNIWGQLIVITEFLFLFSFVIWSFNENAFNLGFDVTYFLRFVYYFNIASYFWYYEFRLDPQNLSKLINIASVISASSIIFCFFTGLGSYTYEVASIGTRGFFTAGNDLGLYANICLLGTIVYFHFNPKIKQLIIIFGVFISNIFIASRVGVLGSAIIMSAFIGYFFINTKLKNNKILVLVIKSLIIIVVYIIISSIVAFIIDNEYLLERFTNNNSLNPREFLMEGGEESIKKFDLVEFFIGRSASGSNDFIGTALFMGEPKAVEAEIHDTISSYGYILGGCILILFLIPLIVSIKLFLKKRSYLRFFNLLSIVLFWGIGIMSGHAFSNAMVVAPMSCIFLIAYRDYISHKRVTQAA